MKNLLKVLAYVDLVLGTIGSLVLANQFGRTLDYSYYLYYSKARYEALQHGLF